MIRAPLAIALCLALAPGCGERSAPCRPGTLFATITFDSLSATATELGLTLKSGSTTRQFSKPKSAESAGYVLEVDFQSGYPRGESFSLTVDASVAGRLVGSGSASAILVGECTALTLTVSAVSADLSAAGDDLNPGLDSAQPPDDLSAADMSRPDDLAAPPDLLPPPDQAIPPQ